MKKFVMFFQLILACLGLSGKNSYVPYEGDYFDGDVMGKGGFAYPPVAIGDLVSVEHVPQVLSDLDGDPLSDDNYFEADIEDDRAFSEGEGGIVKTLLNPLSLLRKSNRKTAFSAPKLRVKKTAAAANVPSKIVNSAISSTIENQIAMDQTPGSRLSKNQLLPFLTVNGSVDAPPTTVPLEGQNVFSLITRYQTTYPALSIQKTSVSTGATITFTFADTDFTGSVGATPVIILSHAASALNAASGAKYTVTVSGYDETGRAIAISAWAYRRKLATDRVLVYLIPYIEVASKLYPVIIKVVSGKSLTVAVTGVPVDESLTCIMPGMNHADYMAFKDLIQVK